MRFLVFRARPVITALTCILLCCAVGVTGEVTRQAHAASSHEKRPIYSVETDRKEVALGINCAWDNADIPDLLSLLERMEVRATFYVVGDWCDRYPESVRAIHEAGHEIGSHSDTHADMTKLDKAEMIREIQNSSKKIEAIIGQRPKTFRPPSGAYNSEVITTIEEQGYYPIQWDCDSIDYKNPTTHQMKNRIMKKIRCGSILLFHSGAKNTPVALPDILEVIQSQGYTFVTVSQLIYDAPYTVDFEGRQHKANFGKQNV